MFFIQSQDFVNDIDIKIEEEFFDIEARFRSFYSEYLIEGPEKYYNGFNFTDSKNWDTLNNESFWYDKNNKILLKSESFVTGRSQLDHATLEVTPQKWTYK